MLMILLITRQDKCDPIFRRQLLSCFVSLRSLPRMDNNYSAQLNFSFVSFFLTFFSRTRLKKEENTSTRECNLSLCCLTILAKPELAKKAFSFSYSSRVHRLDTRSKHHDGWSHKESLTRADICTVVQLYCM